MIRKYHRPVKSPTNKKPLKLLDAALKVLETTGAKAKLAAKQFSLLATVKIKIKRVKKGVVTPDKLLKALNKFNAELKTSLNFSGPVGWFALAHFVYCLLNTINDFVH